MPPGAADPPARAGLLLGPVALWELPEPMRAVPPRSAGLREPCWGGYPRTTARAISSARNLRQPGTARSTTFVRPPCAQVMAAAPMAGAAVTVLPLPSRRRAQATAIAATLVLTADAWRGGPCPPAGAAMTAVLVIAIVQGAKPALATDLLTCLAQETGAFRETVRLTRIVGRVATALLRQPCRAT